MDAFGAVGPYEVIGCVVVLFYGLVFFPIYIDAVDWKSYVDMFDGGV